MKNLLYLLLFFIALPLHAGYMLQNSNSMQAEDIVNFYVKNIELPEAHQEYYQLTPKNVKDECIKDFTLGALIYSEAEKIERNFQKLPKKHEEFFIDKYIQLLVYSMEKKYPYAYIRYANVYFGGEMKQVIDLNLSELTFRKMLKLPCFNDENLNNFAKDRLKLIDAIRKGTAKHPLNPDFKKQ